GVLDDIITMAARRPIDDLDAEVRAVLRLGAYQLLHMRVPAHAAVHTTVDLVRAVAGQRIVGFVNAVLRAIGRQSWESWVERVAPDDDMRRLAVATGYPEWLAAALADALGGDLDELRPALSVDRPVTHLVARPGRISRDELLEQAGPGAVAGPWSPYAVRLAAGGDPGGLAAIRDGRAGVQDEGSQLVTLALARADITAGERWWADVCAGPGGKAALLTGLRPGATRLLATDLHPHRARLVADAVRDDAGVVVADATRPAWRPDGFARVLLDAPCSGLGALRRRPEVRWRRTPDDVERLHPLQLDLLRCAVDAAAPGGVVAYVTCSPHLRESRDVVREVLSTRTDARLDDARPLFPGMPDLGPGPDVQLWPHRHGTDAMYLALVRRLPD
ncbi:MAG TPA: transcription antitermination factor NusB, partial [Mycobacteriales bacterium]|nr:transcription antitermination factor NusB [Mycobacteriales bacterium]